MLVFLGCVYCLCLGVDRAGNTNDPFDNPRLQFFNATKMDRTNPVTQEIAWRAFPNRVTLDYAADEDRWREADTSRNVQESTTKYCMACIACLAPTRAGGEDCSLSYRSACMAGQCSKQAHQCCRTWLVALHLCCWLLLLPSLPLFLLALLNQQDEYCEWSVERNAQGKVTRVMFTCEGPEYWTCLAEKQPETVLQVGRGGHVHFSTHPLCRLVSLSLYHATIGTACCPGRYRML